MSIEEAINDVLQHAQQNSQAWDIMRLGRFTASAFHKLIGEPRSKSDKEAGLFSQVGETYILERAIETLTGMTSNEATSRSIEHGNDFEHEAIMHVWEQHSKDNDPATSLVLKPNFIPYQQHAGGSPDAYIKLDGVWYGLEVKCPFNTVNHYWHCQVTDADSLKDIAPQYYWQCAFHVWLQKIRSVYYQEEWSRMPICTTSWKFASYDPRIPDSWKCHIATITPSEEDLVLITDKLHKAIDRKQFYIQHMNAQNSFKPLV
jgi:hypothetical protein